MSYQKQWNQYEDDGKLKSFMGACETAHSMLGKADAEIARHREKAQDDHALMAEKDKRIAELEGALLVAAKERQGESGDIDGQIGYWLSVASMPQTLETK